MKSLTSYLPRNTSAKALLIALIASPIFSNALADGVWSDYDAVPPVISTAGSGDKPNIMVVLDNSNSMDEAPNGQAVGSASSASKSEIARGAVKNIINTFGDSMRMGLMAYAQSGVALRQLHDSQYDVSFNTANYSASYTGNRDSSTKRFRVINPTDTSNYINYNIALPFYSSSNEGTAFCYSSTANFDNGSETNAGPWDSYSCYRTKTGTSDSGTTGMSNHFGNYTFSPTDSDIAQNIRDFGTYLTWQHVGPTWFSNSSPGGGTVHVNIADVNATQKALLNAKLATSQFSSSTDTPLRNAGLTPIEGTLNSARTYFASYSSANVCTATENEYVVLVTDGLPSTSASGTAISNTTTAITAAATAAANLLAAGVKTYVVGFALPYGVDPTVLDKIATAGGTSKALIASDSASLNSTLNGIFRNIINRSSSGTGAAVLANNSRGDGAYYQALYIPKLEDSLGNGITWAGVLNGLFFDRYGLLREDTNGNAEIDDYATDKIVEHYYDNTLGRTMARYMTSTSNTFPTNLTAVAGSIELEDLKYIWSARDELAAISDVTTQRTYTHNASSGRAIYTSVDGTNLNDFVSITSADLATLNAAVTSAQTTKNAAYVDLQSAETLMTSKDEEVNQFFLDYYDAAYEEGIDSGMTHDEASDFALAETISEPHLLYLRSEHQNAVTLHAEKQTAYDNAVAAYNQAAAAVTPYAFHSYMGVATTTAQQIIRWVRGDDTISGYRSRAFDWTGDGNTEVWRLGDIIHSTPEVVGPPSKRYDITDGDTSYAAFVDQYAHRRHVIYVGANDGMLHAFNSGFWDNSNFSFELDDSFASGTSTLTQHPLGSELWAYVPKAALPHLQWLTSPSYAHTYYVDGEPKSYDVNIFTADADHPNGWGTILVVPMRFGGGLFSVDTDGDSVKETKLHSSISIFDITNPEVAPKLLAEISHPDLGFTTSRPALVKARDPSSSGFSSTTSDRWLLAFGSGPDILDTATSSKTAKLFLYDLSSLSFVTDYDPFEFTTHTASHVGDVNSTDWNKDYIDDTLYFAINTGIDTSTTADNTERGRMMRLKLDSSSYPFDINAWIPSASSSSNEFTTLIDFQRTSVGTPQTVKDNNGRNWIFTGTGRLFVDDDNVSNMQQRFYGLMEPVDSTGAMTYAAISTSSLENVTNIRVFEGGEVDRSGSSFDIPSGTTIKNFNQLENAISANRSGWFRDLYTQSGDSSGRNINPSLYFRKLLFFTEYVPNDDQCEPEGESTLYAVYYKTGTAAKFDVIGTDSSTVKNSEELVLDSKSLGQGIASSPNMISNSAGLTSGGENGIGTLVIQKSTGGLDTTNPNGEDAVDGRDSWREISLEGMNL